MEWALRCHVPGFVGRHVSRFWDTDDKGCPPWIWPVTPSTPCWSRAVRCGPWPGPPGHRNRGSIVTSSCFEDGESRALEPRRRGPKRPPALTAPEVEDEIVWWIPPTSKVHRDRVDTNGTVTLRHRSKLHHVGVGRAHKHERVLILVADLDVRVIDAEGTLLRHLTLDPLRATSPFAKKLRSVGSDVPESLRHHSDLNPKKWTTDIDNFGPDRPEPDMPRHYPAELRRQTCERMLAGEAVKDLSAGTGHRRSHPLQVAAPGADRCRPEAWSSRVMRLIRSWRPGVGSKELEAELKAVKAAECALQGGRC